MNNTSRTGLFPDINTFQDTTYTHPEDSDIPQVFTTILPTYCSQTVFTLPSQRILAPPTSTLTLTRVSACRTEAPFRSHNGEPKVQWHFRRHQQSHSGVPDFRRAIGPAAIENTVSKVARGRATIHRCWQRRKDVPGRFQGNEAKSTGWHPGLPRILSEVLSSDRLCAPAANVVAGAAQNKPEIWICASLCVGHVNVVIGRACAFLNRAQAMSVVTQSNASCGTGRITDPLRHDGRAGHAGWTGQYGRTGETDFRTFHDFCPPH
ncbi:hypothetical protein BDN67DRAFT_968897 [Paxillus ammoniavirescens]|nr:hypothetical protein BDN67DRAFT_968897 [Paxillus ammoniavirescens]